MMLQLLLWLLFYSGTKQIRQPLVNLTNSVAEAKVLLV